MSLRKMQILALGALSCLAHMSDAQASRQFGERMLEGARRVVATGAPQRLVRFAAFSTGVAGAASVLEEREKRNCLGVSYPVERILEAELLLRSNRELIDHWHFEGQAWLISELKKIKKFEAQQKGFRHFSAYPVNAQEDSAVREIQVYGTKQNGVQILLQLDQTKMNNLQKQFLEYHYGPILTLQDIQDGKFVPAQQLVVDQLLQFIGKSGPMGFYSVPYDIKYDLEHTNFIDRLVTMKLLKPEVAGCLKWQILCEHLKAEDACQNEKTELVDMLEKYRMITPQEAAAQRRELLKDLD